MPSSSDSQIDAGNREPQLPVNGSPAPNAEWQIPALIGAVLAVPAGLVAGFAALFFGFLLGTFWDLNGFMLRLAAYLLVAGVLGFPSLTVTSWVLFITKQYKESFLLGLPAILGGAILWYLAARALIAV